MTLILGISDKPHGRAFVFFDSGMWSGDNVSVDARPKAWRAGKFIVSMCGAVAFSRVAERVQPESDEPQALVDKICDAIALTQRDRWAHTDSESRREFGLVIATGERVLDCGVDGGLAEPTNGIVAIGAGSDFARGAAIGLALQSDNSLGIGNTVMRLAREHTRGAHGPIRWLSTDGGEGVWE